VPAATCDWLMQSRDNVMGMLKLPTLANILPALETVL